METTKLGSVTVTRFLLGGNPFSGFSHQGHDRDREMVHYYTTARIKQVLFSAEKLGITGFVGRADNHVVRLMMEYWDEGGKLTWLGQSVGPIPECASLVAGHGGKALHIHGGVMDNLVAQGKFDEIKRGIDAIRAAGLSAGIAGHNARVFEWAAKNVDVDYCMCCHYNPTIRDVNPDHVHGAEEKYREEDRKAMVAVAGTLTKPVIHYKILAAGRNNPGEAFAFCGKIMKPADLVCVGIYAKDDPGMLGRDVGLFEKHCAIKK